MVEMKAKRVNADELKFDEKGLIAAIAQDYESGEVLMQAFMNREAVEKTFETGYAHYYSRSRASLWKKGETSGNTQKVITAYLDCDKDCILLKVRQKGVACHTGMYSCFSQQVKGDENEIGAEMFGKLQRIVEEKKPRRRLVYEFPVRARHRQNRQKSGRGSRGTRHRVQERRQGRSHRGSRGLPLSHDGAACGKGRQAFGGLFGTV